MSPQAIQQYSNAAEAYQETFVPAIAERVAPPLLEQAALVPGERVLDVACGTGVVTRRAAEMVGPAGRVAGLDLSPEMIEVAASLPARPGCAPEWRQGDAGALPYRDATFDVVLCQMGLMFFPDRAAALREMRRVLVPGGRVVVGTPGAIPAPFSVLDAALVRHISPDLGGFVKAVFSLDDPGAMAEMAAAAGLADAGARTWRTTLRLPPPQEFLWQYVASTPLRALVNGAPLDARAALEAEVVRRCREWVADGQLMVDLSLVLTHGRAGGGHAG